jgi:methylmalonyl-CoA mutase
MPNELGTEILQLWAEFPPVSTAEWEAVVKKDLKGADYEKKLVWRPEEDVAVRPYYRREALEPLGELADLAPGDYPYTRGGGQSSEEAQNWVAPAGAIRGDFLHEAGATTVQELGFALAEGVAALAAAIDAGKSVDAAASATSFVYAVGSNYFLEIAKLRAARVLWSMAVSAFGPEDRKSSIVRIHVRTARSNKSLFDPYTNLLRVTTEAASAMIGGCDSLTVGSLGFDPHLSLNVQRILKEEAYLTRVLDPAGGSYYIEALTDSLAQAAWKLFQKVEAAGGWSAALQSGLVEKALADSREAKAAAISSRRRTLVGVNNYPNALEKTSDVEPPALLPNDPFPQTRLAEPFEAIRRRTAAHARVTGHCPKVLLLTRGDLKMKTARINFCMNFFGCAGFDLVEAEEYKESDADLIILCSSDAEYLSFAQEVCGSVSVPVLVAGNPKEQVAQLQALGVQGFVHVFSNALETLAHWQDKLGMKPVLEGVNT